MLLGMLLASGLAHAEAKLSCDFKGNYVAAVLTNSNDKFRTCKFTCSWQISGGGTHSTIDQTVGIAKGQTIKAYQNDHLPADVTKVLKNTMSCDPA
ncbi:hypothetical protein [Pandoraea captiosa]|nr:hypothetical protein [Pandoraea captiosa]